MARKRVVGVVKINVEAGQASPAPPVGTALGPHGIAIMDFCKAYNEQTQDKRGQIIPAVITIYEDRSFTFVTKTPPTSFLVRQAARVEKGAESPGREQPVATITRDQARRIAETKLPDLNTDDVEAAAEQVIGTARSMGIAVTG